MTHEELVRIRDEAARREERVRPRALRDLDKLGQDTGALMADLARITQQLPDPAPLASCPALQPDEESCECDAHYLRGVLATRVCPLTWYKAARVNLSGALALCGYGADLDCLTHPVAELLRRKLELRPEVRGLDGLIELVDQALARGFRGQAGHLALIGTPGTAKTHALLTLYFAALWEGVPARWVESAKLARLAQARESRREDEHDAATTELRNLRAAKILFIDDLGDRITDQYAKVPGSTKYAALMLDLLNKYEGRVMWSSNLPIDPKAAGLKLTDHPDVGPRLLSRLLADHKEVPALGADLEGLDQRRHHLRKARKAARFTSRLERTSDAA